MSKLQTDDSSSAKDAKRLALEITRFLCAVFVLRVPYEFACQLAYAF